MSTPILASLGLLVTLGAITGAWIRKFGVPRVTGYVLAGTLLSPDLLGHHLGIAAGPWSEHLTTAALGVIAYLIGGSLTWHEIRPQARLLICATLGQGLVAALVVWTGLWLASSLWPAAFPLALAGALGVIATTTAPAASMAVIHQYRVRGPLSRLLLAVVGLDDALGILLFVLFLAAADATGGAGALSHAGHEIGGAVMLGGVAGLVLGASLRHTVDRDTALPSVLGVVLGVTGAAQLLGASPLLACMALGFAARARYGGSGERLFAPVEEMEELVFVIFFTVAGMHFRAGVFAESLPLVFAYGLLRAGGKVMGAHVGARLGGAPPGVGANLGLALLPQAGVAIGLALQLTHSRTLAVHGPRLLNVILAATIVNELLGPLAARFAFRRAGELGARSEEVFR